MEDWYKYIIESKTFEQASKYAAEHDWWLHSWQWFESKSDQIRVYINEDFLA